MPPALVLQGAPPLDRAARAAAVGAFQKHHDMALQVIREGGYVAWIRRVHSGFRHFSHRSIEYVNQETLSSAAKSHARLHAQHASALRRLYLAACKTLASFSLRPGICVLTALNTHITEYKRITLNRVVLVRLLGSCFTKLGTHLNAMEPSESPSTNGASQGNAGLSKTRRAVSRPPLRQPPRIIGREISRQPYRRAIAAQDREALQQHGRAPALDVRLLQ